MHTQRHQLRTALVAIAAIGLALTAAHAAFAGGACHEAPTEGAKATIELRSLCFSPTVTEVEVGSIVEFVNLDGFAHNVVGHGVSWGQVEDIAPGDSVIARFDTVGVHPFSCTLHPGMVGAIVVGGVTGPESTAPSSGVGAATVAAVVLGAAAALWYLPRKSDLD